jgi:PAS domain S-box-containing protein
MQSRIVLWTQGAERLYGFSKAEALNRVPHDLFHTQFPISKEDVDDTLRRSGKWYGELVRRKSNGERVVVSSQQLVYHDADARPVRVLEVNADITERKETEAALRESEQRFRQLTENISEVFWLRDTTENQVLYVSPAYEKLWGRSCESLYQSSESWFEAIHPEDRERVQAALAGRTEGFYDEEFRILRSDGTVRWIRDRAFPVRDSAGGAKRVVGVAEDITVHKEVEAEQLERSEMRFRLLIEHASDLITLLNVEGLIRFQSPSLERVLGYAPAELSGQSVFELIHPDDLAHARESFERAFHDPSATVSLECRLRHHNGRWRMLQSIGRALPANGGEGLMVLNSRDITSQKHLEDQLRQAQKMEAVGQLAGGVAHDFNNLLSVIVGHTELLELSLPRSQPLLESVTEIGRAAERAAALTRQLLAFSRQQVLEFQVLDLNAVVASAEKMLRRLIGEDVQLTTKLHPGLSPVRADPGQIDQVLLNLAVNARDAPRWYLEFRNQQHRTRPDLRMGSPENSPWQLRFAGGL